MASTTGTIFNLTIKSSPLTDASLITSPFFPLHLCSKAAQEPAMSALLGRSSYIRRALCRDSWPVQNMRVDHGGGDIRMSQEFLHRAYIVMGLQQMRGKGMPEGMAADLLAYPGPQSPFSLFYLPVLHAGSLSHIGQKAFDILTRTIAQTFFRKKLNKGLSPLDIKTRMIGPHPVIFHTGPKSIPESLHRCSLLWMYLWHKTFLFQEVKLIFRSHDRQNYNIIPGNFLATC